ncbi:MAG TPA: class I SAM-dependent methyltransferase [Sphingomicrobium sp.]|nr:class I SAM-dependent methyltransferase [Sphingomicrobium sp.]
MDAQVYERMAELDGEHWWFVARRDILKSVIERVVRPPRDARILEVGCGTGHNLAMLSSFGRVEATEMDKSARALAAKRLGRDVEDAALPDLSAWPEAHFDLVALLDVLEHVPDDTSALEAIRERLKPGGKLLVTVPANKWMWSAHDVAHHHHRRYRKSELARLARDCGFAVDLLSPFNTLLFPLVAAARAAGKVTGREAADDALPPRPVNALLKALFGLEAGLIGRVPMPFGVSLVAVLRRPA